MLLARLAQAADAITREGAREAAREELARPEYQADQPSLLDRAIDWVLRKLGELIADAVRIVPGGVGGVALALIVLVALVVLLRLGLGPLQVRDALTDRRRGAGARSAEDYRREAERLAAGGDWKGAVRARFRAAVRELEQRGLLDPRPGRTAGEIACEAGAAAPAVAGPLTDAARTFDEVWYGDRAATGEQYELVCRADAAVTRARLTVGVR